LSFAFDRLLPSLNAILQLPKVEQPPRMTTPSKKLKITTIFLKTVMPWVVKPPKTMLSSPLSVAGRLMKI
jgi:hypothetical protein